MRLGDRLQAMLMHATARFSVRYGADLGFAGQELPRPRRHRVPTRHGVVPVSVWRSADRDESPRPIHVHFHGGAWLMRYPEMDDWWCRYLVATAGVTVVNVDFHTGPYVAYPVAQEECHDVCAWLASEESAHGAAVGGDGTRLSVGGFSSGGGIAAAICHLARDSDAFRPALQVLGVPALDLASDLPSGNGMISPSLRALVRRVYFPDAARRSEPAASPLLAEDVSGLPPAVVLTGARDTLRPDGDRYAARLAAAGVPVVHDVTPGVDHYFLTEDPVRARTTMAMVAEQIRSAHSLTG